MDVRLAHMSRIVSLFIVRILFRGFYVSHDAVMLREYQRGILIYFHVRRNLPHPMINRVFGIILSVNQLIKSMIEEQAELVGRTFRHFKGNLYRLEGFAKDSETLKEMVVYRALYGEGGLWVRPAKMFFETVERDGRTMKRFEPVEDEQ